MSAGFVTSEGQIIYSNMDHWWSRKFKESGLIGGSTVHYFEPGPWDEQYQELEDPIPGLTPWSTSNVKAKVGVVTGNHSVFHEPRGDGYCVRMETNLKKVVVLGVVNVKAIASGSIFTGGMVDPITDPEPPRRNTLMGIPFEHAPTAMQFDYKTIVGRNRQRATGGLRVRDIDGRDKAEAYVILQNRVEDNDGNLTEKRVGTGWVRFDETTPDWVNDYQLKINYGDITDSNVFESYMGLIDDKDPFYSYNSKGDVVQYLESGWSSNPDDVTHIIVVFSASYEGGEYKGSPESKFWIDNVKFIYE
ncbi:PCMD domain-containing protein [Prolixibacteraceae bacterium Z1-6]|uniref:PCMD domain-containing protein n=1 Tax=Draconibacterium aestuarii TaxID=2998507 RepID=A0A9X3J618_9BACT|nr:PCMD domain-containing protein [Prolixibacteraceae bacterium Z1-6]